MSRFHKISYLFGLPSVGFTQTIKTLYVKIICLCSLKRKQKSFSFLDLVLFQIKNSGFFLFFLEIYIHVSQIIKLMLKFDQRAISSVKSRLNPDYYSSLQFVTCDTLNLFVKKNRIVSASSAI